MSRRSHTLAALARGAIWAWQHGWSWCICRVMLIFKLTRVVCPCARGSVTVVRSWKIPGSSTSVIRLLPSVRHLTRPHDNNTRFEKVGNCSALIIWCHRDSICTFFSQENIFTIPNVLSLGRIVLSPVLGYFVLSENYKLALTFFVLAGVSDMVGTKIKCHACQWLQLILPGRWLYCSQLQGSVLPPWQRTRPSCWQIPHLYSLCHPHHQWNHTRYGLELLSAWVQMIYPTIPVPA